VFGISFIVFLFLLLVVLLYCICGLRVPQEIVDLRTTTNTWTSPWVCNSVRVTKKEHLWSEYHSVRTDPANNL